MTNLNDAVSAFQAASAELDQATKEQHLAEDRLARAQDRVAVATTGYRDARKALLKVAEGTHEV